MLNRDETLTILHQIRNCLNPIQTFLHLVSVEKQDPKMVHFKKICKENLEQLKTLLDRLENET